MPARFIFCTALCLAGATTLALAEDFAGGAFDHHHVGGTRHEDAARGGFDSHVVRAAFALDIELLDFERLRLSDVGYGKARCGKQGKYGENASSHKEPHLACTKSAREAASVAL